MSLITMNIPEALSANLLALMERLVVAAERIAGPPLAYRPPTQATLRDYAVVRPEDVAQVRAAEAEFAAQNMVVPGSEAFVAAVKVFEDQVEEVYGPEGVAQLPWKVRTGDEA